MELTEGDLREVVRSIWESVLGWEVCESASEDSLATSEPFLTGRIEITGAWNGTIVCQATDEMARQVAEVMFAMTGEEPTVELVHDAFGELTNMIGGNFKALLPGPSVLGLPVVVEGKGGSKDEPARKVMLGAAFVSREQPFQIALLASEPALV